MPEFSSNELIPQQLEQPHAVSHEARFVIDRRLTNYALLATERLGSEKIAETSSFFTKKSPETGKTPTEQIAAVYDVLDKPNDPNASAIFAAAVRAHAAEVTERAFDQQVENPKRFLSHGFDHTLNVLESGKEILRNNEQFVSAMQEKYGIQKGLAEFMLKNVVLFHDTGYKYLGERGKAAHALAGADIVASERIRDMFRSIIRTQAPDISRDDVELLIHDFRDAILFHNADTIQHAFSAKIVTSLGEFLVDTENVVAVVSTFQKETTPAGIPREVTTVYVQNVTDKEALEEQLTEQRLANTITIEILEQPDGQTLKGRVIDLQKKDDKLLGLAYKEVDVVDSPMLSFIRLADNMDITSKRFMGTQKEPAFQEAYMRFGNGSAESQTLKQLEKLVLKIHEEGKLLANADRMLLRGRTSESAFDLIRSQLGDHEDMFREKLATLVTAEQAEQLWKEVIVNRILQQDSYRFLPDKTKQAITDSAVALDSHELQHFGGCEPVKNTSLHGNEIIITVDKEKFNALNTISFDEVRINEDGTKQEERIGLGEYQIWRLAQAYKSIRYNGEIIALRVVDEHGEAITVFQHE